jgi:hypothetical protein
MYATRPVPDADWRALLDRFAVKARRLLAPDEAIGDTPFARAYWAARHASVGFHPSAAVSSPCAKARANARNAVFDHRLKLIGIFTKEGFSVLEATAHVDEHFNLGIKTWR